MYPGTHDLIHLRTADQFFFFTDGRIVPETIRRSEDINEMNPEHPLRSLVLGCLQSLPEDRPTAVDLVNGLTNFKESNDFYPSQNNAELQRSIHRVHASQYDYEFKVVMVGDQGVGKTSIATKFVRPNLPFQDHLPMTVVYGKYNERLQLKGKSILLQIVDTSGQYNLLYKKTFIAVEISSNLCGITGVKVWDP